MDANVNATKKAYTAVPLQGRLRICWFIFTCLVTAVWTTVYFSETLSSKTCYVRETKEGTFVMVNYIDDGVMSAETVINVDRKSTRLNSSHKA